MQIRGWSARKSGGDLHADQGLICKQISGWSAGTSKNQLPSQQGIRLILKIKLTNKQTNDQINKLMDPLSDLCAAQITPWSACRWTPDLRADEPLICVQIDRLSDLCADHPLICVQINPWSACRWTLYPIYVQINPWSASRSTPDLHADQSLIGVQIRGERARPLLAKAPPGAVRVEWNGGISCLSGGICGNISLGLGRASKY